MPGDNKLFEDLSRLGGSAAGILNDARNQIKEDIKTRVDEMAARLDLVPRENFDALAARVEALEKMIADLNK